MHFRLSAAIALVAAIAARVSAQVEPSWNTGVNYSYDGAGNVYRMGTDTFKYDAAGRLVEAKANGIQRNYAYDRYGNRTQCVHAQGTPSQSDCQYGYTINAAMNRIVGVTYDDAGNLHKIGGHTYTYDALNALTRDDVGATPREYVYDANGERIAVHEVNAGKWRWTFRDPSGKVLREFTSTGNGTTNWKWTKDYIWRDGLLLATRQIEPGQTTAVTYHYHLDHLGTPRRITNDADQIVGIHSYHAFGPEVSGGRNEPALSVMKFTGHERDTSGVDSWDTLDYMHARYYNGTLGRFLSVDPTWESADLGKPQSWNRYSYVMNNPVNLTDPDGKCPTCVDPSDHGNIIRLRVNVWYDRGSVDRELVRGGTVRERTEKSISEARAIFATAGIRLDFIRQNVDTTQDLKIVTESGTTQLQDFAKTTPGLDMFVTQDQGVTGRTAGVGGPTLIGNRVGDGTVTDELAHALGNTRSLLPLANVWTDLYTDFNERAAANGKPMNEMYTIMLRGGARDQCAANADACQ